MGVQYSKEEEEEEEEVILSTKQQQQQQQHQHHHHNDDPSSIITNMKEHSIPLEFYSLLSDMPFNTTTNVTASAAANDDDDDDNNSTKTSSSRSIRSLVWKTHQHQQQHSTSSNVSSNASSSLRHSKQHHHHHNQSSKASILRFFSSSSSSTKTFASSSSSSSMELNRLFLSSNHKAIEIHLTTKHPQDIHKATVAPLYNVVRKFYPVHLACATKAPLHIVKLSSSSGCGGDAKKMEELVMTPVMNISYLPLKQHQQQQHEQHQQQQQHTITIDETSEGWLPLHIATYFFAPHSVVDYLLQIAPQAAKCKNSEGYLPVHFLCANLPFSSYSSYSSYSDNKKSSSLEEKEQKEEQAKIQNAQWNILQSLLRAFPDSIHVPCTPPSPAEHETPLQLVKRCFPPTDARKKMEKLLSATSGEEEEEEIIMPCLPPSQITTTTTKTAVAVAGGEGASMDYLQQTKSQQPPTKKGQNVIMIKEKEEEEEEELEEDDLFQDTTSIHSNGSRTGVASVQSFTTVGSSLRSRMHRPHFHKSSHSTSNASVASTSTSGSKRRHKSIFRSLRHHHHSSSSHRKQKEIDPSKPTKLYTHISNRDWKSAAARLHKCPHEASVWTLLDSSPTPPDLATTMEEERMKLQHLPQQSNPNANEYGCHRLPLHKACTLKPPLDFVQSLYESYQEAMTSKEKYGMLPLHVACQNGASLAAISFLLSKYKEAASIPDNFGLLPLHLACTEGLPVAVVVELLRVYPSGLEVRDERGRTPADYVRESVHPNRKVLLNVLEQRDSLYWLAPRIPLKGSKKEGDTKKQDEIPPLYSMVQKKEWEKITMYLHEQSTEEVQMSRQVETKTWVLDENYDAMIPRLPIHVACVNRAPPCIISNLLDLNPASITAKEKHDAIPLHLACSVGSVDMVSTILSRGTETAKCKDSYGLLPIHVACTEGANVKIVEMLLKAYPESGNIGDGRGNTPVSFVEASFHPGKREVLEVLKRDVSYWKEDDKVEEIEDEDEDEYEEEETESNEEGTVQWLIDEKQWDAIPPRLQDYPEEARIFAALSAEKEEEIDKQLPLHRICTHRPKRYLIRALLKVYPEATQVKTEITKELPLHLAIRHDAWAQVVELLVDSYPESIWEVDRKGRVALHTACSVGASVSVVKTLLDAAVATSESGASDGDDGDDNEDREGKEDITQVKDLEGMTPLDYVESSSYPHKSSLLSLLDEYNTSKKQMMMEEEEEENNEFEEIEDAPKDASFDTTAMTELFQHVENKEWVAVVSRCREHPEEASIWSSMTQKEDDAKRAKNDLAGVDLRGRSSCKIDHGKLPIHLACASQPPARIISALHNAYPDGTSTKERDEERCALHIACQHGASLEVIELLIKLYPDAISIRDKFGLLPIHLACSKGADIEVIKVLLRAAPGSAAAKDKKGWTALEYAELSHPNHSMLMEELSSDDMLCGHRRSGMGPSRSVPDMEDGLVRQKSASMEGMSRSARHLGRSSFDTEGGVGGGQIPLATQ